MKRQRDGRVPVPPEQLAALLSGMPYYRELMAQLEPGRRLVCGQLFSQYQRGILWQDAQECFQLIENRYLPLAIQISRAAENGRNALSALASLPEGALDSPSLGAYLRAPMSKPEPAFVIRDRKTEPRLAEQYRLTRLSELMYLELIHLLFSGASIQKCGNCGRFFLPERGYSYRYCSRVAPGESERTCRDIGAARARHNKLAGSTVLTVYQRAYKRYYARVLKQRWSKEQFQRWQEEALRVRSEAEASHWSGLQLEDKLRELAENL